MNLKQHDDTEGFFVWNPSPCKFVKVTMNRASNHLIAHAIGKLVFLLNGNTPSVFYVEIILEKSASNEFFIYPN